MCFSINYVKILWQMRPFVEKYISIDVLLSIFGHIIWDFMKIFQDGAFLNFEYHLFQVIWSVSTKCLICQSNFTRLMLKHTKSLETSDIPSWEMSHLGISPWNLLDVSKYAKTWINMSVFTKGLICQSNFTLLMLKHSKSLETSNIPSLEMPHRGIIPWNPIRCFQIC